MFDILKLVLNQYAPVARGFLTALKVVVRSTTPGGRPNGSRALDKRDRAILREVGIRIPASSATLFCDDTTKERNIQRRMRSTNRYLAHQFRRLERAREADNHKLFWTIGAALVKRSRAYRMAHLNKVLPDWYYAMARSRVRDLMFKVHEIAVLRKENYDSVRVYIPKSGGRWRSLGVPAKEWRIYLSMWNSILYVWLKKYISKFQYGGVPGRSVADAWAAVIQKVIGSRDIYEYDLKGFFNSLRLVAVNRKLYEVMVPEDLVKHFYAINKNYPKPAKEDGKPVIKDGDPELGDVSSIALEHFEVLGKDGHWKPKGVIPRREVLPTKGLAHGGVYLRSVLDPERADIINRAIDIDLTSFIKGTNENDDWFTSKLRGIPQGSPWSGLLSIYMLEGSGLYEPWTGKLTMPFRGFGSSKPGPVTMTYHKWPTYDGEKWETIQFVDDGLWYGEMPPFSNTLQDSPMTALQVEGTEFTSRGLEFADKPGANGPVRKQWKWIKPLTFLGLTYYPESGWIKSKNGSKVRLTRLQHLMKTNYREYVKVLTGLSPDYSSGAKVDWTWQITHGSPLWAWNERYGFEADKWLIRFELFLWEMLIISTILWCGGFELPLIAILAIPAVAATWWEFILPSGWKYGMYGWHPVITYPMWMSTYFSQTYLKGMTKSLKVKRPKKRVTLTSKK